MLVPWAVSGNSYCLITNPFSPISDLHLEALQLSLSFSGRDRVQESRLQPRKGLCSCIPPEQLPGKENSSNSCKSSHQYLLPVETTTDPHIKAACQLPRQRINSLTEGKPQESWMFGAKTPILQTIQISSWELLRNKNEGPQAAASYEL